MRKLLLALIVALSPACVAPSGDSASILDPQVTQDQNQLPDWYGYVIEEGLDRLFARLPLDANLNVYVGPLPGLWGCAMFNPVSQTYEIFLSSAVKQPDFLLDILVHEYAHCLVWGAALQGLDDDHGALWGMAYSAAYLAVLKGPVEAPGSPQDESEAPEVPEAQPPPSAQAPDEQGCVACH